MAVDGEEWGPISRIKRKRARPVFSRIGVDISRPYAYCTVKAYESVGGFKPLKFRRFRNDCAIDCGSGKTVAAKHEFCRTKPIGGGIGAEKVKIGETNPIFGGIPPTMRAAGQSA